MLDESNRDKYGSIRCCWRPKVVEILFIPGFDQWKEVKNTDIILTIDNQRRLKGRVGYPHTVSEMEFDVNNTYAVLCVLLL